ncbi:MAG TPA: hypothetical protein VIX42_10605 [Edaphobacter sp.]
MRIAPLVFSLLLASAAMLAQNHPVDTLALNGLEVPLPAHKIPLTQSYEHDVHNIPLCLSYQHYLHEIPPTNNENRSMREVPVVLSKETGSSKIVRVK